MKIAGKELGKRSTEVVIIHRPGGPISFTVQALPLGFLENTVLDRIPRPTPPKKYAMKHGRVLKDQFGQHVAEDNFADPDFKKAFRKASVLFGVASIHEGLRADPNVTWDTKLEKDDWVKFYEGIYNEMVASGMTTGEMSMLGDRITALSTDKGKDMEAAREGFLSEGQDSESADGSSQNTPAELNAT